MTTDGGRFVSAERLPPCLPRVCPREDVCGSPAGWVTSVPLRGNEARCWPAVGRLCGSAVLAPTEGPFCRPEASNGKGFKGSPEGRIRAMQKVRFLSWIKAGDRKRPPAMSHRPATRVGSRAFGLLGLPVRGGHIRGLGMPSGVCLPENPRHKPISSGITTGIRAQKRPIFHLRRNAGA